MFREGWYSLVFDGFVGVGSIQMMHVCTGWPIKKGAIAFSPANREFFFVYAHFFHTMLVKTCFKSCANFKEKYKLLRKLELIEVGSAKNAVNSWVIFS